jgi:CheY-like chemotaxis protein
MKRLTEILSAIANGFRVQRVSQKPPQKVLIVDDDAAVRAFLDSVLVAAGYDTTVTADGPDALAAWDQAGPFDVIVTDLMMPQMRGDELAHRVRVAHPDTKVLYVTGYPDALFAGKPRLWQDEAFLEKPFTPDGVLEAVTLLLNGRIHEKAVWG